MSNIKCPNCGNIVPEGSAFCNRCGSRIQQFSDQDYNNDWNSNTQSRLDARAHNSQNKKKGSNTTKYVLIALAAAAFIALFIITRCNDSKPDVQAVSTIDNSAAAAADTLQRVLADNNYDSDGARIVYAKRIDGSQPGVNDLIVGITQFSSTTGESFYKIYKLVKNNGKWSIDPENITETNTMGYDVTFDQNRLKAGRDIIPQIVDIGNKKYFFYAYMQNPKGDPSNSKVVLNLYNVETRAITAATYEGAFQNVNGEQTIVCTPASGNTDEIKWMNETARNFIRIIHFQGEEAVEETQKPEEEQKPEEPVAEEPKPEQPSNSAVVGEAQDKDTPMFKLDDVSKKVQAGNYIVYMLKDGSVIRYDKATGKNTKIHSGGAKDIGFYDTSKGIVSIRNNDDTRKRVDLGSGQIVNVNDAPAAPKEEKKEEKKEETNP